MIPVVEQLNTADEDAYWWSLSLGACFGGNTTIVAAAANVACQGVAERHGVKIAFGEFLEWGLPATASRWRSLRATSTFCTSDERSPP